MTIHIRYDPILGTPYADGQVESILLCLPEGTSADRPLVVSTENIMYAARALKKEGKIEDVIFYFEEHIMRVDKNGRIDYWPWSFPSALDRFLERLL